MNIAVPSMTIQRLSALAHRGKRAYNSRLDGVLQSTKQSKLRKHIPATYCASADSSHAVEPLLLVLLLSMLLGQECSLRLHVRRRSREKRRQALQAQLRAQVLSDVGDLAHDVDLWLRHLLLESMQRILGHVDEGARARFVRKTCLLRRGQRDRAVHARLVHRIVRHVRGLLRQARAPRLRGGLRAVGHGHAQLRAGVALEHLGLHLRPDAVVHVLREVRVPGAGQGGLQGAADRQRQLRHLGLLTRHCFRSLALVTLWPAQEVRIAIGVHLPIEELAPALRVVALRIEWEHTRGHLVRPAGDLGRAPPSLDVGDLRGGIRCPRPLLRYTHLRGRRAGEVPLSRDVDDVTVISRTPPNLGTASNCLLMVHAPTPAARIDVSRDSEHLHAALPVGPAGRLRRARLEGQSHLFRRRGAGRAGT
mmetsp:Transcript_38453/g.122408  ORF Transcript_38453/g.122408 Transcript_38453/m.122408 type:complete len:421 (+) Transcript_38453:158-1420(+)